MPKAQPLNPNLKKDWRDIFIDALSTSGVVSTACKVAGIHHSTAYDERRRNEAFAASWDTALVGAVEGMEQEAWRRAVQGNDEPVFQRGEQIGMVRKYSDTLLIFLLKANKPEKYRDNYKAPVPQPPADLDLDADVSLMSEEERRVYQVRLEQYLAKVRAAGGQ